MSIPATAIRRPITMYMLSGVIVLLGSIALTRLPVDLLPDLDLPSITVRVNYSGVGPLEMEELVTRPLEQSVAAVAGLDQINSTSSEGSSVVRLNFTWGTNLNAAADDVRSRVDRIRGRLPQDADSPVILKFDSTATPIIGVGVESLRPDLDRVALRELAENDLARRLERVPGVAAVTVDGGLRRQIHVELSREKITALDLSVDRVVNLLRTENQNIPLGEITEGDNTFLLRSQGQFNDISQIRDLVIETKQGVPVYMRDVAEVKDSTEDFRSFTRINGQPGIRMRVTKQSGENTIRGRRGDSQRGRAHEPRSARRAPRGARRHLRSSSSDRLLPCRKPRSWARCWSSSSSSSSCAAGARRSSSARRSPFRSSAPSRCSTSAGTR